MKKQIFINIPVSDLEKSKAFYSAIGFVNNPQFSDDTAACMVVSEEIYVMLMGYEKFKGFTNRPIGDVKNTTSSINSLSVESNEAVNELMGKALEAGGTEPNEARDYGFMYQRSILDLDGNFWEVFFMDVSKFPVQ